jgi:succinate dehydrogenase hydrophobic anchor subunit
MLSEKSVPKTGENVWVWLLKIVTGVLVIALLFTHLIVNHLVAPEGLLTYQEVVAYLSNPLVAVMELSFLVIVVSHALVGTRSIILDLNPSRGFLRVLDGVLVVAGVASIVYGVWLVAVIISQG